MARIALQDTLVTGQGTGQITGSLMRSSQGIEQLRRLGGQPQRGFVRLHGKPGFTQTQVNLAEVLLQLGRGRRDRPCRLVGRTRFAQTTGLMVNKAEQATLGVGRGLLVQQGFKPSARLGIVATVKRRARLAFDLHRPHHAIRPLCTRQTMVVCSTTLK